MARCSRCDAHNADDAAWCSQCFQSFDVSASTAASGEGSAAESSGERHTSGESHVVGPRIGADPGSVRSTSGDQARDVRERDVREREGTVEWHCATCDTWNDLFDERCGVCGGQRLGFGAVGEEPAAAPPSVSATSAIASSLLLPGLGHFVVGRSSAGLARIVVFGLWMVGGVSWTLAGSGPTRPPGLVLLFGAALLWVSTQFDVVGLVGSRRSEPFGNRGLLWLVVGVTVVLAASVAMLTLDVVGRA